VVLRAWTRWVVEHAVPSEVREDVSGDLLGLFYRDSAADGAGRATARYRRHAVSCSIRFGVQRCGNVVRGGAIPMGPSRRELKLPLRMLVGWRMDLALAARMLIRHPALSAIAVFGITVAIAIAATMFTIATEQLSPSPLPLPQGDRIVALQKWDFAEYRPEPIVPDDVRTWQEQLSTIRDIGAFQTVTRNLIVPSGAPEPIEVAEISAAAFDVAGTAPMMGRVIRPEDERADAVPVVVIGHAEWRRRFDANPHVLETTVQLGDTHHTVVGVMPEGFAFPIHHAYWIPLRLDSSSGRMGASLSVFGRLASGATLEGAQSELTAVGDRERRASPSASQEVRPRVVPYAHQFSATDQPGNRLALQLMRFLVGILLVVVSINIAVLVYARTAARQAEFAVRTALGASRGRIVMQLFSEGLVLAGVGALAGVALAAVALAQVREVFSREETLPFWMRFDLSGETITYTVGLTLLAAAVIGALPAWNATGPRIQNRLQALTAGGNGGMHLGRVWTTLILLQVAIAVALLPMVVVRMSELARDGMQPLGLAAHGYVVAQLSLEGTAAAPIGSVEAASRFAARYRQLEQKISATGTARASTFSTVAPGFESAALIRSDVGGVEANVRVNRVAVNFFDTFGVPILTGRDFVGADAAPEARAVIVNRSFSQVLSSGAEVLGSRIRLAPRAHGAEAITGLADDWYEIVGIVEDFPASPSETAPLDPKAYRAITPDATDALIMALHLHATDTEAWGARLRRMAADVDPTLQVTNVTLMDDLLGQHRLTMRLLAAVFGAMTLSVLLLSAAGIYAMMAFSVTQRRREIGIRLALGAGARRILWTVFSRAGTQLLAGTGLGTGAALLLDRAAEGGLMSGHAAVATAAVVLLMTMAGLLAALGPARQGLRIQPAEALRHPLR
jgi:putative ABC transport system permease protein